MNKGFNLLVNDFKNDLVTKINNSGIPIVILEMIISDIAFEIARVKDETIERERLQYEEDLRLESESQVENMEAEIVEKQ